MNANNIEDRIEPRDAIEIMEQLVTEEAPWQHSGTFHEAAASRPCPFILDLSGQRSQADGKVLDR